MRDGNKVVGKRKSGDKYYLNSIELLIEMMKNNMFSRMYKILYYSFVIITCNKTYRSYNFRSKTIELLPSIPKNIFTFIKLNKR